MSSEYAWLWENSQKDTEANYTSVYGEDKMPNQQGKIIATFGKEGIEDIVTDLLDLLGTCVAVYDKSGDYAFGMFAAGWCQYMYFVSGKLPDADANNESLVCKKWLIGHDCWNNTAKKAIKTGKPVEEKCAGGIHIYGVPIVVEGEIVGAINMGYGNPITDDKSLKDLSESSGTGFEALRQYAISYNPRPAFIIELAKKRLKSSAKLIGQIIYRKKTEQNLIKQNAHNAKTYLQQLVFNSAINSVAEIVKIFDNHEEILEQVNKILGETLQLDRALIYYVCFDENYILGLCEWLKEKHPDIEATKDRYSLDLFKKPFSRIKETQRYLESHLSDVNEHYIGDGSGDMLHGHFKIKSLVWYPFDFDGNNFYVFTLNQILHERTWTEYDLKFIDSIAKQLSLAFMKLKLSNEREALNESREQEKKLADIVRNTPVAIAYGFPDGRLDKCNEAFSTLTGYTYNELLSMRWNAVLTPQKWKEAEAEKLNQLTQTNRSIIYEKEYIRKNGTVVPIELHVTVNFDPTGNPLRYTAFIIDITERKKAEQALEDYNAELQQAKEKAEESEEKFKTLVENASDWIWEVDAEGQFIYASPKVKDLLGYEPEEVIGKNAFDLMSGEEAARVEKIYAEYVKRKIPFSGMINVNIHKSGREVIIETNGIPFFDKEGNLRGYRGIDRDITERKRAEQEIIKAKEKAEESDKLKSAFLANMSHEIRTPLNTIIGFTDLLQKRSFDNERLQTYIRIMNQNGHGLLNIINDILELSKIDAGVVHLKEEPFMLLEVLEQIKGSYEATVKSNTYLRFETKFAGEVLGLNLLGDKNRIIQVLNNLMSNAIKFTREGSVTFQVSRLGNELCFSITDTGIGISRDDQAAVFERFTRIEDKGKSIVAQGTGLGLAISKTLVELMGGKIWVESELLKGSCFSFCIPVRKNIADQRIGEQDKEILDVRSKKIIIADDEPGNVYFLEELLSSPNHSLFKAENGVEVLEILKKERDIEIILLDLKMPEMDGFECAMEVKKMNQDIKIIAISAFAFDQDIKRAKEAGCDDFITKPVDIEELLALIE